MGQWCQEQHGKSGLTQKSRESPYSLTDVEAEAIRFISPFIVKGKNPLAGNSIHEDRRFLMKYMPSFMDLLHYRIVDVSTIKEIGFRWFPKKMDQRPSKRLTHRSVDDILESIEELRFYRQNLFIQEK
eukprot:TRINITY_DN548_c0_g1_i1.p1 TRINITY_DN548_c0_g1~~TRINITY_DN548_c0_g1_i1.p1  ORF type:complete len:128 (+),score=29.51 TRINITY_DN548_c0_g1_i1:337-720(+)